MVRVKRPRGGSSWFKMLYKSMRMDVSAARPMPWWKAGLLGASIEGAAWLLPACAFIASSSHPEDTLTMLFFEMTQLPSILLAYVLLPAAHVAGISTNIAMIVSYALITVSQGMFFAVVSRIRFTRE